MNVTFVLVRALVLERHDDEYECAYEYDGFQGRRPCLEFRAGDLAVVGSRRQ
jgi:hypothetical protein